MKKILWLCALGMVAGAMVMAAEPPAATPGITTVKQALDFLFEDTVLRYKEAPSDHEVVRFVRAHLDEARAEFVERYLGKKMTELQAIGVMTPLGYSEALDFARAVVQHYPGGDLTTPFVGILAARGNRQDLERLAAVIAHNPDAPKAGELAELMLESPNRRRGRCSPP